MPPKAVSEPWFQHPNLHSPKRRSAVSRIVIRLPFRQA
jgi:hypothetical protein